MKGNKAKLLIKPPSGKSSAQKQNIQQSNYYNLNQKEDQESAGDNNSTHYASNESFSEVNNIQNINQVSIKYIKHTIDSDPQQCEQYSDDIFQYLLQIEGEYLPNPCYMDEQSELQEKMRAFLIDWIFELHQKFRLYPETLYLTVHIIDRYLSTNIVSKRKLQLVGICCMNIACKYEEIYPPEPKDFIFVTKNSYALSELIKQEREILNILKFKITQPYSYTFYERFIKLTASDKRVQNCIQYLLELSLMDYQMIQFKVSLIASAAFYYSCKLLNNPDPWPQILAQITQYDENDLQKCASMLAKILEQADQSFYKSVKKKFAQNDYGNISNFAIPKSKDKEVDQLVQRFNNYMAMKEQSMKQ